MMGLLITFLLILIFTIIIGTPVAFALGFTAIGLTLLFMDPSNLVQIGSVVYSQGTSVNQLVAPLFILMAEALAHGGIAKDIFIVINKWLRRLRGGLALSATFASTVFAALCGSSPATAAAIGRVSVKEMIDRGYSEEFATGVVAAGGTLGIMIPPSISLIIYGILTENSIAQLFMAGIIPGLLTSGLLCIYIFSIVRIKPSLIERTTFYKNEVQNTPEPVSTNSLHDLKLIAPPLLLVLVVMGSLYTGFATPTEAAGFGSIGALILVLFLGRFNANFLTSVVGATARTSSMIIFMIFGGMALSYVVSYLGITQSIADLIIDSGLNKWVIVILIYFLWLVMGALMDPLSMVVLTIPFIYPTFLALGFDPLWLGIVSTLAVEIGMITPPVGLNLFVLKSITSVPMNKIMIGSLPFVLILILSLIIITIFPEIVLYLPSKM